ncbi:Fic family protein [Bacteroides caecimuris]|jgi:Fic family protein|uniref:Cell filamentation protein Fic n=3 Tax=Bacteroides caecimuris TaxID=1796613 RepID=A0A1C7GZ32_9BACE|nr:Fic family protein [Bacteroides caecimuris]ANU56842.1 cell filamentation protein Fic [Bacteroides caecimuris]OXE66769.1 cell filamentation protein Fic [Bacteroides caecimuris]QQR18304.1 Fic family protein [Bacteroides caecimuris]UQA31321.1 Fic family protein [Bacteroides caecimuris]
MYIHERDNWTAFRWNATELTALLEEVNRKQGLLYGRLASLGFDSKLKAMAENLTYDVVYSSEIEGIRLNVDEVRSSIARKLGIENVKQTASSHYIDSVVAVMLDAVNHYDQLLTKEKICAWQTAFFPTGFSEGSQIEVGQYRTNEEHIVSGMFGREKIHYIAPSPERVDEEMAHFLDWFNGKENINSVIRSAIAHFWFVSIHPFEDGNGRLARILSDMLLARADKSEFRFYNISSQINQDKNHYYDILEKAQHGDGDITEWIYWYASMLSVALDEAENIVSTILNKSFFWQKASSVPLSQRQTDMLNLFLDGYEAKITSKTWASLAKCSKDTAIRDIQDLVDKDILREDIPGAKRPSYSIIYDPEDITAFFSEISIEQQNGNQYIKALYKGKLQVCERILPLDAERFEKGDLPLENLLAKYCSYLRMN